MTPEDWRDLTEAALMAAGYEQVTTAESAADAYTLLGVGAQPANGSAAVDLIVLDLVMPEIDGIEACARIRGDTRYVDVPVIMVTAASDMDSLSSAFIAGATDYITKPFNRVELLARVRSALKIKAELDRRKARESELTALMRSTWGDRDAGRWIDQTTNLFVGTAAEAYLAAEAKHRDDRPVSVFALGVDRLDALTAARGQASARRRAGAGRQCRGFDRRADRRHRHELSGRRVRAGRAAIAAGGARALGQALRTTVISLGIANSEAIAADGVTISLGIVTARRGRTELVADARRLLKEAMSAGGNRVTAVDLSSN